MALFECYTCHHLQETTNEHIGKNAKCPKCQDKGMIHNTLLYVKEIREKYLVLEKKLQEKDEEKDSSEHNNDLLEIHDPIPIDDFDIHNTNIFSQKDHYAPIIKWFKEKSIQAKVDPKMMDTTGFFDEVAIYMGNNFHVIDSIIGQIKYIQNKKYDTVKITLSKNTKEEVQQIIEFCKMLHQYSFIARFNFQKKDKVIYLTLQDIPKIKSFFNGLWMEWFVLIKIITFFKENNITLPIIRGVDIIFPNKDKNELDIFFINTQGDPICIECKTGEFRQDLSKYLTLQKKLNIKKENFILCVFGLDNEQAQGLTSMYEITLVNESTLVNQIKSLF